MLHAFPRTSLYSELLIQWCALSLIVMHLFRPRSVYHDNWTTENGKLYYKNMYIIIGSSALPASQYSCWNSPTSSALHQSREYEVRKDDCPHYCYHSHIRTIQVYAGMFLLFSCLQPLHVSLAAKPGNLQETKFFYFVCKVERIFPVKVVGTASVFLRGWVGWLVSPCSFSVLPQEFITVYKLLVIHDTW